MEKNPFMITYQYQYVVQPDRLNNGTIGTFLRKGICISMSYGYRTEMTSALHEVPSSTGNLIKVVIHSLFTCYFVNTHPHA